MKKTESDKTILEERTVLEPGVNPDSSAIADLKVAHDNAVPSDHLESFQGYKVLAQLPAQGSEADIYRINYNGKPCILKLYRFGTDPNIEAIKKIQEIGAQHPENVIRIHEFDLDEFHKRYFEIMEMARYGSLKDALQKGGALNGTDNINGIIREIVNGLKVLHRNNLLHLDLKPSNILVRDIEPLNLIFSDFGISSLIDDEISRKMTINLKGTPLYWSPEAFTQVVGRESDFWSLGIIILEMLMKRHPLQGLDMRIIMYTLSTRGVKVPKEIPSKYQLLLKGLLTRNPRKRWGINQVEEWLSGNRELQVHYDFKTELKEYASSYQFRGEEYLSLTELLHAFIKNEESWMDARDHIGRGFLEEWLEKNGDYDNCVRIDKLRKHTRSDWDFALVKIIQHYIKGSGFVVCGKLITFRNVFLYTARMIKGEATEGEKFIIRAVINGSLLAYYEEYLTTVNRDSSRDDFYKLLSVMKFNVPRPSLEDSLKTLMRIFRFWWEPEKYVFPSNASIKDKIDFIRQHADLILALEDYQKLLKKWALPLEIDENLRSRDPAIVAEYLRILFKMKEKKELIEKQRIIDPIYLIKDYLEFDKERKSNADKKLLSRIPFIENQLDDARFKQYELRRLSEYLEILRNLEVTWTDRDKEIISQLLRVARLGGLNPDAKRRVAMATGAFFGVLACLLTLTMQGAMGILGDNTASMFNALTFLGVSAGMLLGCFLAFEAPDEKRINSFIKGLVGGTIFTVLLQMTLKWLLPYINMPVAFMIGGVFGFIVYFPVAMFMKEKRFSAIHEQFFIRISDVINDVIREKI